MSSWHYTEQIGRTQAEDREASRRLVGAPSNESSVKFVITEETLVSLKSLYLFTLSACYWGLKFLPLELSLFGSWIVSYFNANTFRSGSPRNCYQPFTIEHWFNEEFLSTESGEMMVIFNDLGGYMGSNLGCVAPDGMTLPKSLHLSFSLSFLLGEIGDNINVCHTASFFVFYNCIKWGNVNVRALGTYQMLNRSAKRYERAHSQKHISFITF